MTERRSRHMVGRLRGGRGRAGRQGGWTVRSTHVPVFSDAHRLVVVMVWTAAVVVNGGERWCDRL